MRDELLLGIDLGTSSIKANVLDRHGRSLGIGTDPTPFATTAHGVEMSASALLDGVRRALVQLGELRHRIAGVGISSMGETGTLITDLGPSDLPLVAWYDHRGTDVVAAVADAVGADEVLRRTGRRARNVTSIAKLGWLAQHGAVLEGVWTGVAGLVLWQLSGALGQENSLAATSGAYNPQQHRYDPEILSAAGLQHVQWAPAQRGGTLMGRVTPAGAAWSELPIGIPVTIAGHDHPVGVVGAGGESGEVIDSLGTGEPLVVSWDGRADQDGSSSGGQAARPLPHPCMPGQPGDCTVEPWPGTDRQMLLWETLRPGLAMTALLTHLPHSRSDIEFAAIRVDAEPLATEVLLAMQEGQVPAEVLALPAEVAWAAALEGYAATAASAEWDLRALTRTTGPTLLIGGGLRSRRWVEAKMHRARWPLAMATEREAVSRGAALLAGVASGWWAAEEYPPAEIVTLVAGQDATAGAVAGSALRR